MSIALAPMKMLHGVIPSASPRIPPFLGLLAFEATVRLGSMTLAAEELRLTQSAVSHRIRALEIFFGTNLLERLNPGLRTTGAGLRLFEEIAPVIGSLSGLRHRIGNPTGRRAFSLGLSSSLFLWWLSPRLHSLSAAFPALSIDAWTWDTAAEAARAEVDLALVWVPAETDRRSAHHLSFPAEDVFPVGSPGLVASLGRSSHWGTLPLLTKGRWGEETGREWSWSTWLGSRSCSEAMRFRDIGSSLQAAVDGAGLALGRSLLVGDALRQKRLVRLAPSDCVRPCSKKQIARWKDTKDKEAKSMATWLLRSAEQSLAMQTKT